jgi:hypothetical protein
MEIILYIISSVTALATVVLAWLTSKYVKLTHFMLEEMRKERKPLIIIDFIKQEGHYQTKLYMIISNKGLSPAKDISFEAEKHTFIIRDIIGKNGKHSGKAEVTELNFLPIFKDGMPYLAPGNNIRFYIGSIKNDDLINYPKVRISCSYKDESEEVIQKDILIDLRFVGKEDF